MNQSTIQEMEESEENKIAEEEKEGPKDRKDSVISPPDRAEVKNMEENILPSLSSARNTQRRLNLDSGMSSQIGTVNFQRQRLLDLNFSELLRSPNMANMADHGDNLFAMQE